MFARYLSSEVIEEYKERNDWLGEFLDEFCEVGAGRSAKAGLLYDTYHGWARDAHGYARRLDAFRDEMEKRGFERRESSVGTNWYGLSIRLDASNTTYYRA